MSATHFAAIGSDLMAVYGLGETEEAAIAEARAEAKDAEAQFSAVPITAAAAEYVRKHGGAPSAELTVTRRGVSLVETVLCTGCGEQVAQSDATDLRHADTYSGSTWHCASCAEVCSRDEE